ncbi:MAG: hypothetical protein K0V04_01235 [Deltaproteobacteria bacterium]|nr:hypothetical protein [Deltaproteobacteria bacterium]
MSTSFEHKSVWITLVSLIVVLVAYSIPAGYLLASGITIMAPYVGLFIAAVVLQIVIMIFGHIAAALVSRPEEADERDRLIEWRSEHYSSWVLGAGVFMAMMLLATPIAKVWPTHLLLVSMFLAEILKATLRLVSYRRGF